MLKKDFLKELKEYYAPKAQVVAAVELPRFEFVMIDGRGDPQKTPSFQESIEALYKFSYTLKFKIKKGQAAVDYGVMPLEGQWWADDMSVFDPEKGNREAWQWTLMIMQPYITEAVFQEVVAEISAKNPEKKAVFERLYLQFLTEGRAAQTLHIGPYANEGATVQRVHEFIKENGGTLTGKHHEIYLSDMRRSRPENLKTIIRQPYSIPA